MITTEERIIYDMLSAKIGHVPILEITNRKETVKEKDIERYKNHLKYKALRATKKNLTK